MVKPVLPQQLSTLTVVRANEPVRTTTRARGAGHENRPSRHCYARGIIIGSPVHSVLPEQRARIGRVGFDEEVSGTTHPYEADGKDLAVGGGDVKGLIEGTQINRILPEQLSWLLAARADRIQKTGQHHKQSHLRKSMNRQRTPPSSGNQVTWTWHGNAVEERYNAQRCLSRARRNVASLRSSWCREKSRRRHSKSGTGRQAVRSFRNA